MERKWIIEIISALLISVLVYAASSKLFNFPLFVAQLHTHPYLKLFAGLVAWTVPAMELLVSLLLLLPSTRKEGLYGSAALLIIFTGYLCLMLLSGKRLPCSCGGIISGFSWKQHIIFNLIFTGLAIMGIVLRKKHKSVNKPITTLKKSAFT